MAFVPRSTAPTGTALATYWTAFTGECVWYTIGRIREVAETPITDPNRAWPVTLSSIQYAKQIYPNADESNGWIRNGYTPTLGAIACWDGVAGHCMNVEAIVDDTVYLSGYNFPGYHTFSYLSYTISELVNGISGLGTFQGFVKNPYVSPTPPTPQSPSIVINPQTGTIGEDGLIIEATVSYVPTSDSAAPNVLYSAYLVSETITPWTTSYYTESGIQYKRAYFKCKLSANNSTESPASVRFYKTYSTGSIDKTGTYIVDRPHINIIPVLGKWLQKKRNKQFTIKIN